MGTKKFHMFLTTAGNQEMFKCHAVMLVCCDPVLCQMLNVDPWEMPSKFCSEAENSMVLGENAVDLFLTPSPSPVT